MAYEGQGSTVTFGTSGLSFNIISIGEIGKEAEDIDTTHLGTTGGKTSMPASLYDAGECPLEVEYDPTVNVTVPGTSETITYNLAGQGRPIVVTGYVKGYKVSGAQTGQRITATLTVKHDGTLTQVTTTAA